MCVEETQITMVKEEKGEKESRIRKERIVKDRIRVQKCYHFVQYSSNGRKRKIILPFPSCLNRVMSIDTMSF